MYIHNATSWVLYIVPDLDMCVLVPEGLMEWLKLAMLTGYSVIDHMLPNALALYQPWFTTDATYATYASTPSHWTIVYVTPSPCHRPCHTNSALVSHKCWLTSKKSTLEEASNSQWSSTWVYARHINPHHNVLAPLIITIIIIHWPQPSHSHCTCFSATFVAFWRPVYSYQVSWNHN